MHIARGLPDAPGSVLQKWVPSPRDPAGHPVAEHDALHASVTLRSLNVQQRLENALTAHFLLDVDKSMLLEHVQGEL